MPEILELAHLVHQHRVTQMQVRGGRVETDLDSKRPTLGQTRLQVFLVENLFSTAQKRGDYLVHK